VLRANGSEIWEMSTLIILTDVEWYMFKKLQEAELQGFNMYWSLNAREALDLKIGPCSFQGNILTEEFVASGDQAQVALQSSARRDIRAGSSTLISQK
jgi:hypothetical protein